MDQTTLGGLLIYDHNEVHNNCSQSGLAQQQLIKIQPDSLSDNPS